MPELHCVGVVCIILIANYAIQTAGWTDFSSDLRHVWKTLPIFVLAAWVAVRGSGVPRETRHWLAMALLAGAAGDVLISLAKEGIVPAAVAFGIGHAIYMSTFVSATKRINRPLAIAAIAWNAFVTYECLLPILAIGAIPVVIMFAYSLVLTASVVYSGSQFLHGSTNMTPSNSHFWRFLGFSSFYFSDSILILKHTDHHIPYGEALILLSYYFAQYLFVRAAVSEAKAKARVE